MESFKRGWTELTRDPHAVQRRAMEKRLASWLNDPRLGRWRRHYVRFFHEHTYHPHGIVNVSMEHVDAFTERLIQTHGADPETLREALESLHGDFIDPTPARRPNRYALYRDHVDALRAADRLIP